MIDFIAIALVVGFFGYKLVAANTNRGAEFLRAFVFLDCVRCGDSSELANQKAFIDFSNLPTEILKSCAEEAKALSVSDFGGKQLPMIAQAYRLGLVQRLPKWQRVVMGF